jgi:hypothetical protein
MSKILGQLLGLDDTDYWTELDRHVGYCLSGRYGSTVAELVYDVPYDTLLD